MEKRENIGKRDKTIDALKGYGILLVMIGHCIVLNKMEDPILYDGIKAVQMPLFMLLSGYTIGFMPEFTCFQEVTNKIVKRSISYLIPFFIWLLLLKWRSLPGVILEVLFQLDRGLWFLMTLFLLTLFMYLALAVRDLTPLKKPGFVLVWMLVVFVVFLQYQSENNFLSPHLTVFYLPFYLCGYILSCFIRIRRQKLLFWKNQKIQQIQKRQKNGNIFFWITGILSAIVFFFLLLSFDMIVAHNKIEFMMQVLASLLGCYVSFLLIYALPEGKLKQFLTFTGTYTLEIYVIHYHFAQILGMADKQLSLYTVYGAGVVFLTFIIMSVLTALSIYILKKSWLTDLLLFGRFKKEGMSNGKIKI